MKLSDSKVGRVAESLTQIDVIDYCKNKSNWITQSKYNKHSLNCSKKDGNVYVIYDCSLWGMMCFYLKYFLVVYLKIYST